MPGGTRAVEGLFLLYKRVVSPVLHTFAPVRGSCCYQPTCSEYAALACAEHGLLRGGAMAAWRVLRCNPLSRGGWDPVPPRTGKIDATKLAAHPPAGTQVR